MSTTVYIIQETYSGFIHGYRRSYESALEGLKRLQEKDVRLDDLVIIAVDELPGG